MYQRKICLRASTAMKKLTTLLFSEIGLDKAYMFMLVKTVQTELICQLDEPAISTLLGIGDN